MLRFCPWNHEPKIQENETFIEIFKLKDTTPILMGIIDKDTFNLTGLAIK